MNHNAPRRIKILWVLSLKIVQKGKENYAANSYVAKLVWSKNAENLLMASKDDMSFSPSSGSHYLFPFDSAEFKESFKFDPPLDIKMVSVINHVAGFYLPCDTIVMSVNHGTGTVDISFELRRNPLIMGTAVMLFIFAAILALLITTTTETGALPSAVAAYFFSMWSVRNFFGLTSEGFPTLFDMGIVLLALLMPLLLVLRMLGSAQLFSPVWTYCNSLLKWLEGRQ